MRDWLRAILFVVSFQLVLGTPGSAQDQATAPKEVARLQEEFREAGEPGNRWIQTRAIPAEEAFQAAAADKEFVYAISNQSVGKYSRTTGERVAVSKGEAKHLNSGFFWNGQLHCAHSNYPLKPEQSQIKALDTQSMQLSTRKDFGDIGGSLTWVLRHEDHWWCNFAYYGAENDRTFLVKFDDEWREQDRFAYPLELISELGAYSLSGGVWRGENLFVTGHDDAVLFQLRLPESGDVLEYVGRQDIPFTGQGIASDPFTGGLVGINRSKRLMVFAEQEASWLPIRVLSYNIHHGEGIDSQLDLERIARTIASVEPDLVMLQEVDRNTGRSKQVDQSAELARLTKMHVVFGENIVHDGGQYGNAILSRFPIRRHQNHPLPNLTNGEQRGLLEAEVQLPAHAKQPSIQSTLLVFGTHLDHRRDDQERLASAKFINARIVQSPGIASILAGDLNDTPDSPTLSELEKHWVRSNELISPTIPVSEPTRQIDYVMLDSTNRWRVVETKVLDEAVASDHRAIFAVFELRQGE